MFAPFLALLPLGILVTVLCWNFCMLLDTLLQAKGTSPPSGHMCKRDTMHLPPVPSYQDPLVCSVQLCVPTMAHGRYRK